MKNMVNIYPLTVLLFSLYSTATFSVATNFKSNNDEEAVVTVKFKNIIHAQHFMTWMSEQGEQDMYIWMEDAEPELAKIPTYDNEKRIIDYSKLK